MHTFPTYSAQNRTPSVPMAVPCAQDVTALGQYSGPTSLSPPVQVTHNCQQAPAHEDTAAPAPDEVGRGSVLLRTFDWYLLSHSVVHMLHLNCKDVVHMWLQAGSRRMPKMYSTLHTERKTDSVSRCVVKM